MGFGAVTLADFLDDVEAARGTITVYSDEQPTWVADQFEARNVAVHHEPLPPNGPPGFVVFREGGEFLASIGLRELREILAPPIRRPWQDRPDSTGYRTLFELLDDTIFTAFDRRQLLGAAREIEDRAWRVGTGTLRVGFQRLSAMWSQVEVYERLGAETALSIHVYGRPDWVPAAVPNVRIHAETAPEIGSFWFLAFDGGSEPQNACALLAEERSPEAFYGFWTYDEDLVGAIEAYLSSTYGR